ncbi:hypothetical protein SAMN06298216_1901 [Spirosomataceae bacterium TFI 002]|nr:hypothetical protein SAMN06298216_1901 [Spirosomataceae bacterium TFI 002]
MKKLIVYLILLIPSFASSQITIDFPRERMTYQRDNNNEAKIYISGNFSAEYDSIRARVVSRVSGQGIDTDWKKIAVRDGKPYFSGEITATGGWYNLQVVAFKNGSSVDFVTVRRVGVGEVFAIAGQSNSSGTTSGTSNKMYVAGAGYGIDTDEDRCNVMHYSNKTNEFNRFPIGYSQMSGASVGNDSIFIGPFQMASWCWGVFAESLVNTLNVPVMIYGAGFGGTSVLWWKESANGENLTNPAFFVKQEYNHPYGALGGVVKYYASLTGLRAVLWHQGEGDPNMSAGDYKYNLEQVIAKTRQQIESPTLAWMVARASYSGQTHSNIISGQNQVIAADANVFDGPETDALTGSTYRTDNLHLDTQQAFVEHGGLWHSKITTSNFLTASNPVMAEPFIDLTFTCNNSNPSQPIMLSTNVSGEYGWSNRINTPSESIGYVSDYGQNYSIIPNSSYLRLNWTYDSTSSITVAPGKYALNVEKASGKRLFSPYVDLSALSVPLISVTSSATQVRPNESVTLTASSCNGIFSWSNNATENPIQPVIATNTSFTAQCKNLHCINTNTVNIVASSCFAGALSLTGGVNSTEPPYKSKDLVNSIQQISTGGKIDYSAKKSIVLNPGFKADQGSTFTSKIEDCN